MSATEEFPVHRRSSRAAAKRSFKDLDEDDLGEEGWSCEGAGDGGEERGRRASKHRGGSAKKSDPAQRQKKPAPVIDDLELATKEAEAEVAALAPRAAALREKNEALAAENAALKAQVAELMAEAAVREAANVELQGEVRRLNLPAGPPGTSLSTQQGARGAVPPGEAAAALETAE